VEELHCILTFSGEAGEDCAFSIHFKFLVIYFSYKCASVVRSLLRNNIKMGPRGVGYKDANHICTV
jgi:hypothetical protein